MPKLIDLIGEKFGKLKVLKRVDNDKHGNSCWLCQCDCGEEKNICGSSLRKGSTQSCGCLHREIITKHGYYKSTTYNSWRSIIQRCTNPNNKNYFDYGGRGIKICKYWMKFTNFLEDMGEAPEGCQIDRINNDKGYYKENCRWATRKQQNRNTRSNRLIRYNGKLQLVVELAEKFNIDPTVLRYRIFKLKWPTEKALITPINKKGEK